MPDINDIDARLTALETKFHDFSTWVLYWSNRENRYVYTLISTCKLYGITYLPTEYPTAAEARAAANSMNR